MGMRVGGAGGANQSAAIAMWQQRQQNMKDLTASLKSGDLQSAQKAFASLTGGKGVPENSPLAQLGQALKSGDVGAAQSALQSLQSARHSHHPESASGGSSAAASTATSAANGVGSLIKTVA